jgi:flagellum-specific peptidoglycan hydrolase FlgJ
VDAKAGRMPRSARSTWRNAPVTPKDFHRTYFGAALANERASGVPALFTLAQSALETGWGRHASGHMMFGIKAGPGWTGRKQLCVTREVFADTRQGHRFAEVLSIEPRADGRFDYKVRDWFRAYDTPLESFADHARMLRANARYANCFGTRDPREFARRIAAAGYATDPGYASSLIALIDTLEGAQEPRAAGESGPDAPPKPDGASDKPSDSARRSGGMMSALLQFVTGIFGRRVP